MYYVATVDTEKCAGFKCNTCTLYCPEPNTLMFDEEKNASWVDADRCKGCALCVFVCTDMLKRACIGMAMAHAKA